jgi:biopolymer transport protein ExbD
MSDARTLHKHRRLEPGINLTPMLDMIFNLIFFFILATQLRQQDFEIMVNLPRAGSATERQSESEPPPVIAVDAGGRLYYKGQAVVEAVLLLELHHLASRGQTRILVRGDAAAPYGRIVEVWDWCRQAGLNDAIMETERPRDGPSPIR